jgi:hypothetical protein
MQKHERELANDEIAELQSAVDYGREHGWDSADEECLDLDRLITAREDLARLTGNEDVELAELTIWREGLNQETAEDEETGREWAEHVEIKMAALPSDIADHAERYFDSEQGINGVTADVRHNFTNYEQLMEEASRYSRRPHEIIKFRVQQLIEEALERIGAFDEWRVTEGEDKE